MSIRNVCNPTNALWLLLSHSLPAAESVLRSTVTRTCSRCAWRHRAGDDAPWTRCRQPAEHLVLLTTCDRTPRRPTTRWLAWRAVNCLMRRNVSLMMNSSTCCPGRLDVLVGGLTATGVTFVTRRQTARHRSWASAACFTCLLVKLFTTSHLFHHHHHHHHIMIVILIVMHSAQQYWITLHSLWRMSRCQLYCMSSAIWHHSLHVLLVWKITPSFTLHFALFIADLRCNNISCGLNVEWQNIFSVVDDISTNLKTAFCVTTFFRTFPLAKFANK